MANKKKNTEIMDPTFAIFNQHKNKADERAKKAFIEMFGQKDWDKNIQPLIDNGIMSIFNEEPNTYTIAYVAFVFAFVNEF